MQEHKHTWEHQQIPNGTQSKHASKLSSGARCEDCGLVAKAPTNDNATWFKALPK